MKDALKTSAIMLAIFTVVTGLVYPLAVTLIAQVAFPIQANGSLIVDNGKAVGSALIGQPFSKPEYFWGRLSATSPVPYNAAASSGSNLGPLNPALKDNAQSRIDALRKDDPAITGFPIDLVTASGSGLDPHISPAAAEAQITRVAKARNKTEAEIRTLVERHIEDRSWGLLGEPRVNVLMLNMALDRDNTESTIRTTATTNSQRGQDQ